MPAFSSAGTRARACSHDRFEMVPVLAQELELEAVWNALLRPRNRIRLIASHDQPADLFLEIDQPVRIAQGGEVLGHAGYRLGHDVLMLHRDQRNVDSGELSDLPGPLPRAIDDDLGADHAVRGLYSRYATAVELNPDDRAILHDLDALHARALGERLRDIGRIGLPIGGQKRGPCDIGAVHDRPERLRLGRRQQMHFQSEAMGGRRLTLDLDQPLRIAGEAQAAVALPAGRQAGFLFQLVVQLDAVLEKLCHVRRRAKLTDQAGGMPGRAAGELRALEQHDVLEARARQMIGRAAPDDAATDDDHLRSRGRRGHRTLPESSSNSVNSS